MLSREPLKSGAEVNVVFAGRFFDEADLREEGTSAAVRAAGNPERDLIVAQTRRLEFRFEGFTKSGR